VEAGVYAFDGQVTIRDRADFFGTAYGASGLTLGYDATATYEGSSFGVPAPGAAALAMIAGSVALRRRRA